MWTRLVGRPIMLVDMYYELIMGFLLVMTIALAVINASHREKKIKHTVTHIYGTTDPDFQQALSYLLGPPLMPGNKITPLVNGDRIFPAMLKAIMEAQRSIAFETYIYWSGEIGERLAQALAQKAREGVRVHVLMDWMGSRHLNRSAMEHMVQSGVKVQRYRPLHWYSLSRLNFRTHRKLLIVDGRIGFIGGVGITDDWLGDAQDPKHWRDTHYQVEGPVVAHMQTAYMDNWLKTSSHVLHGPAYFPELQPCGSSLAHVFKGAPREGNENIQLMFLMVFAAAKKSIVIQTPYFLPEPLCLRALFDARKRGVDVQIMVPGEYLDIPVIRYASRHGWGRVLKQGVRIFEYQPTMLHSKLCVVDGIFVSVGSANFDHRSFELNDEANLNVYDTDFAADRLAAFETDKEKCQEVTLKDWRKRPFRQRAKDGFFYLLRAQL